MLMPIQLQVECIQEGLDISVNIDNRNPFYT